ncbi:MAG: methyltransferase domain-containing protein [Patescibacteria group bacterium]
MKQHQSGSDTKPKLHIGCGLIAPAGWVNLDGSAGAWIAKHPVLKKTLKTFHLAPRSLFDTAWSPDIVVHDIRRRLPFDNDSIGAAYGSHLLEHLYRDEAVSLLGECFRVLAPGGIVRMMVPDLRGHAESYLNDSIPTRDGLTKADVFVEALNFRDPHPVRGSAVYRLYTALKDFHTHKWMYDADSLSSYFKEAGFTEIRTMKRHESRIKGIEEVERNDGLCVEGLKPDN